MHKVALFSNPVTFAPVNVQHTPKKVLRMVLLTIFSVQVHDAVYVFNWQAYTHATQQSEISPSLLACTKQQVMVVHVLRVSCIRRPTQK